MNWSAISTIIAALAALAAVGAFVWNVLETRRSTRLRIFTEYTRRYHETMLMIPTSVFGQDFDLRQVEDEKCEVLLRAMRAYFDMCWEELYLNKAGKLEPQVWKYWQAGMVDLFKHPVFGQAWDAIQSDRYYDRSFHEFVGDLKVGELRSM